MVQANKPDRQKQADERAKLDEKADKEARKALEAEDAVEKPITEGFGDDPENKAAEEQAGLHKDDEEGPTPYGDDNPTEGPGEPQPHEDPYASEKHDGLGRYAPEDERPV